MYVHPWAYAAAWAEHLPLGAVGESAAQTD